jgi:predicted nucleic acid-binding protein
MALYGTISPSPTSLVEYVSCASALESSAFAVVPTSDVSRLDAVERFRSAPTGVSFTDCLVMKVADDHGAKDIFGFDRQFEDAGYNILMPTAKRAA